MTSKDSKESEALQHRWFRESLALSHEFEKCLMYISDRMPEITLTAGRGYFTAPKMSQK